MAGGMEMDNTLDGPVRSEELKKKLRKGSLILGALVIANLIIVALVLSWRL